MEKCLGIEKQKIKERGGIGKPGAAFRIVDRQIKRRIHEDHHLALRGMSNFKIQSFQIVLVIGAWYLVIRTGGKCFEGYSNNPAGPGGFHANSRDGGGSNGVANGDGSVFGRNLGRDTAV